MTKKLRILYAAGPGDVIGTYQHWVAGQEDPSQVAITYSGQFYEVCQTLDAKVLAISSCADKKFLRDGQFTLEHRPIPLRKASGILYHLGQLWYGLRLIASAISFRAKVAIVADGTTQWFVLSLLAWLGVQVIPSLHCTLWCKYLPQRTSEKLILKLSRNFFASKCAAILTVSHTISEQVALLTGGQHRPIVEFLPTYRRIEFSGVRSPDEKRSPFRVLFAGRIEEDKGVFELLEIAKRFAVLGRQDIRFDICGNGSALLSLRQAAKLAGVEALFACHGQCNKAQMRQMYNQAHATIVPTKTNFVEGFNKVVAESILSGRPVVTSAVCPALSYVQQAVVEVPPDDTKAYGDALLKLCDDREFYKLLSRGCIQSQQQFYDLSLSWGAALKSILIAIQERTEPQQSMEQNKVLKVESAILKGC